MSQINSWSEIYFAVASVATIAVGGLVVLCFVYVLSILMDIKRLSKLAKREVEFIARSVEKGASIFGNELGSEAAGFVKTLFALLLSQFGANKSRKTKKNVKIA